MSLCGSRWSKNRGVTCGKEAGHPVSEAPRDHEFIPGNLATFGWPDSEGESPAFPAVAP